MKLFVASDHAGYKIKTDLLNNLVLHDIEIVDLGCDDETSIDYPDYAKKLCKAVVNEKNSKGILICGTGIGMSMAANKMPNIRAALCFNTTMAHFAREHNDANVLCFGARIVGPEVIKEMVDLFINTEFSYGRHKKRVDKIEGMNEEKDDDSFDALAQQLERDLKDIEID